MTCARSVRVVLSFGVAGIAAVTTGVASASAAAATPTVRPRTVAVDLTAAHKQSGAKPIIETLSADGQHLAYTIDTVERVDGRSTVTTQLFVEDLRTGSSRLASRSDSGAAANSGVDSVSISGDGRYVAFASGASNLAQVSRGPNGPVDNIFLRDMQAGTTRLVSVADDGPSPSGKTNSRSWSPSVSRDGRFVAFVSLAPDLVPGQPRGRAEVFVRDMVMGITRLVSVSSKGAIGNGQLLDALISDDGHYVAFDGRAANLTPDATFNIEVFRHDLKTGSTRLVSRSVNRDPSTSAFLNGISRDGRYIVLSSIYPTDPGTLGGGDVYRWDADTDATTLVNVTPSGRRSGGWSQGASVSSNGRYVCFSSTASDLVAGDTNSHWDAFVRDLKTGRTNRISVSGAGRQGNGDSSPVQMSGDGRRAVFASTATNLVPDGSNTSSGLYLSAPLR